MTDGLALLTPQQLDRPAGQRHHRRFPVQQHQLGPLTLDPYATSRPVVDDHHQPGATRRPCRTGKGRTAGLSSKGTSCAASSHGT
jgi:hypothetical protein